METINLKFQKEDMRLKKNQRKSFICSSDQKVNCFEDQKLHLTTYTAELSAPLQNFKMSAVLTQRKIHFTFDA